jgi:hypothetical protein
MTYLKPLATPLVESRIQNLAFLKEKIKMVLSEFSSQDEGYRIPVPFAELYPAPGECTLKFLGPVNP